MALLEYIMLPGYSFFITIFTISCSILRIVHAYLNHKYIVLCCHRPGLPDLGCFLRTAFQTRTSMIPVVDNSNPFYCPREVAPDSEDARRGVTFRRTNRNAIPNALASDVSGSADSDLILGKFFNTRKPWPFTSASALEDLPPYSDCSTGSESPLLRARSSKGEGKPSKENRIYARKRSSCEAFSDFDAPPEYARSIQTVHLSSFDLDVRHETLQLNGVLSSPRLLSDTTVPRTNGNNNQDPHSMISLIEKLDAALPGVRLSERLWSLKPLDLQNIADFLSDNGTFNLHISAKV